MGPAASLLAAFGLLTSLLTVSQTLMSAPASATSATISLSSTGDTDLSGVLASVINLSAPDFSMSSDTATDVTGKSPAGRGDTVQDNLTFINSGDDPSTNTVVSDPLSSNVTYVPGSLAIVAADGTATPLTDTAGDDQAEFDPATNTVTARLGCGADASTGGVIVSASTTNSTCTTTQTSLIFRVRLGAAGSTPMTDGPQLNYAAQSSGVNASYDLPPPSYSDTGAGSSVEENQGGPAGAISDIASSLVPGADSTSTSSTTTASTTTDPTSTASTTTAQTATAETTTAPTTSAPPTTAAATTAPATTVPTTTAPDMGSPASAATPPPAPPAAAPAAPWSAVIQAPLASVLPALPDPAMADPAISVAPPPTVVIASAAPTTEMPPSIAPANVASPAIAPARAAGAPPSVAPPRAPDPPALPAIFERLAATGSNPFAGAGVAVILLVAGLVLMIASGVRRRR